MSDKEKEMRESKVPWFDNKEDLIKYITELEEQEHDYGTCVYAMSMAAMATFNYMADKLGCTGFQASCADMDILRRSRRMKHGFRILDYDDLLYPQYKKDFPITWDDLIEENLEHLAKVAQEKLDAGGACYEVRKHWIKLVEMYNEN
jgi:hypothetical protein